MKEYTVIFDIDGTTFQRDLGPNGRSPYDMSRVGEDAPVLPVLEIARLLWMTSKVQIVFVTGRDTTARIATVDAINTHFGGTFDLYMRPEGDNRPDETLKLDILAELRKMGHNILCTFDDRDKVVAMWRAQGIVCFQAQPGAF